MNDSKNNIVTPKLRFHKDREEEYKIYQFLKNSSQSATKAVIACANEYLNVQSEQEREDRFLTQMEEVIQDNLKALIPLMNLLRVVQPAEMPSQSQTGEEPSIPEEEKLGQMQDFLKSFDEDAFDPGEERQ